MRELFRCVLYIQLKTITVQDVLTGTHISKEE